MYSGSPQSNFLKSLHKTQHDNRCKQVVYRIQRVIVDYFPLGHEAPWLGKLFLVLLQNIAHHFPSGAASHPRKTGILNHTAVETSKLNNVAVISTNEYVKFGTRALENAF
jgi:hypothetical protein